MIAGAAEGDEDYHVQEQEADGGERAASQGYSGSSAGGRRRGEGCLRGFTSSGVDRFDLSTA